MKCEGCSKEYNGQKRTPRFLIKCGHSICQKCLKRLFADGCIICPSCDTANYAQGLEDFPVNMALIEEDKEEGSPQRKSSGEEEDQGSKCPKHGKKYEGNLFLQAFCEDDKSLICINCILEGGYQSRKILSVEDVGYGHHRPLRRKELEQRNLLLMLRRWRPLFWKTEKHLKI